MRFTVEYLFNLRDRFSSKAGAMARASAKARTSIHATGSAFNKMEGDANRAGVAVNKLATRMRSLNTVSRSIRSGGLGGVMTGVGGGMLSHRVTSTLLNYEKAMNEVMSNMVRALGPDGEVLLKGVAGGAAESAAMIAKLRSETQRIAQVSRFSPTEVAGGLLELARAGFEAKDAMQMLHPVMRLAGAANLDAARSTDIATNIQKNFKIENDQTAKTVDLLAMAVSNTNMNISQLGEAMKYAGPSSFASGRSLQETVAVIMSLATVGQKGSMAGTTLARQLESLYKKSGPATKALKAIGLTQDDFLKRDGKSIPIVDILQKFNQASEKFGNKKVLAAIQALMGSRGGRGAKVLKDMIPLIQENMKLLALAEGRAKLMERVMMSGVYGAYEKMRASLIELVIKLGDAGLSDVLSKAADAVRSVANSISNLSPETKKFLAYALAITMALSSLIIPLGIFAMALGALAPAAAMAALGLNRIAKIAALPFFATIGSVAGYMSRLLAALVGFGPKATNVISKLVRGFAGFTAIGLAIQGVVEYFSEIKSFFSGFFSGIAENWQGSELQRLLSWVSGTLESIVKYLADLMGFEFKSDGLKAFFEAGAAAAKILLNPLESIRAAFEYLLGLLGSSFRLTGQAQATASNAGAKLGSTAALKNATSVQKRQAAMNAMLMRHEKAKPLSFEGVQKYRVQSTVDVNFTNPTVNVKVDASGVANRVVPLPASVQPRGTSTALPGVESGL